MRMRLSILMLALLGIAMPCPGQLAVGLVEWWNLVNPGIVIPPGGGPLSTSAPGAAVSINIETDSPIQLDLARTDRATGAALPALAGWTVEPLVGGAIRDTYNGRGTAQIPAGVLSLAQVGRAVTLAARLWAAGGQLQGGAAGPVAKPMQLLGLAGQWQANPTQESGLSIVCPDPTAGTPTLQVRQWNGSSATLTTIPGGATIAGGTSDPYVIVAVIQRVATGPTGIRVTVYVNGVQTGLSLDGVAAADIALSRVTFGDMVESDGSLTQAAVWSLGLSPALIAGLEPSLDCLGTLPPIGGGGPGSDDPLLNEFGETAIHPEWTVPRTDLAGVLATDGPQRHTRRTHELVPRVYELHHAVWSGYEVDLIREALEVTKGGVLPTRWRHPQDDAAGPVSTAPRWLIVNAGEWTLERGRGAGNASTRLVIQEVL